MGIFDCSGSNIVFGGGLTLQKFGFDNIIYCKYVIEGSKLKKCGFFVLMTRWRRASRQVCQHSDNRRRLLSDAEANIQVSHQPGPAGQQQQAGLEKHYNFHFYIFICSF